MLKDLLKNSKLIKEIKKFHEQNQEEILDIIIFGSIVRGKKRPADIDLLLVFKNEENAELAYELKKILEKYDIKTEITGIKYQGIFEINFLPKEAILSEGYSLITGKSLSDSFGFKTYRMFIYSQEGFSQTKRMKFHYALNGRGDRSGILGHLKGLKLSNSTVIIPLERSEDFKDFLEFWDISFKSFSLLIPERTIEYKEFEL